MGDSIFIRSVVCFDLPTKKNLAMLDHPQLWLRKKSLSLDTYGFNHFFKR